ncbi:cation:proton antiporter [Thiohalobacter thiocyanaticus]|uniref:Sodium:proton antiporter n=1 Tax=Thiohalobacter thiocyanaticus TaxID=585455 RepID=A0A426QGB3_9GAMM|nr:sodium:proton antiporter [Thiohalobacter thiocyanaticus]RRQ20785.1 sodium:proton antiporter [Thiohalobacter thiocyanaticus]
MDIELVAGRILFLALMALTGLALSRLLRLDLTLGALIAGVVFGLIVTQTGFDTGIRAHNFKPLVFYIILPVLIFQAAWHIRPRVLQRVLVPAVILAVPGVLISCFVMAGLSYLGIAHPVGFPWIAALLTGAILAATDPVSVVAKLRSLNAPDELEALIETESLLNDAAAVVLFGIVLAFALGEIQGAGAGLAADFGRVFFGGLVTGLVLGLTAAGFARWLASAPVISIVTVITALGSFYLAEHILHVSGILAVMSAALTSRILLRDSAHLDSAASTWEWLGLLFNALVFALLGLVITYDMFTDQWLAMLIAIAAMLFARALSVGLSAFGSRLLGQPVSWAWQGVLFWGGLRGAIAIALVLSLPVELPYWWTIQSMVFGAVLFSILVQGTTVGFVAGKLDIRTGAGNVRE